MKILAIGDLHGQKPIIHFKDFDCIIQIGDICSDKEFRPYYNKWFQLLKKNRNIEVDAEDLIIEKVGKKGLNKIEKESLKKGRKIFEYLNSLGKPVFVVPGNWDQSYGKLKIKPLQKNDYYFDRKSFYERYLGDKINPYLTKGLKNIFDCQYKLHKFGGVNFIGYGLSSGPEKPRRKSKYGIITNKQFLILKKGYNKIKSKLSNVYNKRNKKFPTIFISHNIPHGNKLDLVKNKKSYANKKHLGSIVAEEFCKKFKPIICIGGHIHERKGKDKIGKTIVINTGFGKDANVLMDLDEKNGKIRKIEFYK